MNGRRDAILSDAQDAEVPIGSMLAFESANRVDFLCLKYWPKAAITELLRSTAKSGDASSTRLPTGDGNSGVVSVSARNTSGETSEKAVR